MLMSAVLRYFCTVILLLLVTCNWTLVTSATTASNALHNLGDFTSPYDSIFSPLLKALSDHGGSRWSPGQKKKMKPEHRYMKYLKEVYKKSSRLQRSLDGDHFYNTVRLIQPQDECLAQSTNKGEQAKRKTHLNCHIYYHICKVILKVISFSSHSFCLFGGSDKKLKTEHQCFGLEKKASGSQTIRGLSSPKYQCGFGFMMELV